MAQFKRSPDFLSSYYVTDHEENVTKFCFIKNFPIFLESANEIGRSDCKAKRSSSGYGKPARITMWTDTRMELTGADVKLFCRASGFPTPQVTWERAEDGQIIHNDPKHKVMS